MKYALLLSVFAMLSLQTEAQKITYHNPVEYSYDKSGNVVSRIATVPNGGVWNKDLTKIDISDEITVVRNGDMITVDLKKDYNAPAVLKVCDTTPVLVKTDEFNTRTYTFDISGYHSGVYVVNVNVEDKEGTKTFSK